MALTGLGRREQAKAERRLRIMAAARDLIRETGDTDLSMRTIAKRAKVRLKPGASRSFGPKWSGGWALRCSRREKRCEAPRPPTTWASSNRSKWG